MLILDVVRFIVFVVVGNFDVTVFFYLSRVEQVVFLRLKLADILLLPHRILRYRVVGVRNLIEGQIRILLDFSTGSRNTRSLQRLICISIKSA